ncbi:Calcium/calmodulin-dependent 3' [Chlorella vulgaris]
MFSRFLGSEWANVAARALHKLMRKEELEHDEEYAVERLCSWLSRVQGTDPLVDDALDETQREFLLSYRLPEGAAAGSTPGGGRRAPGRQYILPQRTPRADGLPSAEPSRASSEETEAVKDPELQEQLQALEDWEAFNVFKLAQLTDGRPLQTVTLALLRKRGLVSRLGLPEDRLRSFLADAEEAYHPHNPYHNSLHAADVTQARTPGACQQLAGLMPGPLLPASSALGAMLALDDFAAQLSDLEQLAVILAAAIHDVGHPGVNNDFLIRTQSEAAVAYNDISINENMHAAAGFKLLAKKENNFLSQMSLEDFRHVRRLIIRIILSTDMAAHHDSVDEFAASLRLWGPDLAAWAPDKRVVALQLLVHAADISNPARPLRYCCQWGHMVHEEFFAQGDKEAALGMPVSSICDRQKASVAQSQLTFVEYVVKPCFLALAEFAPRFAATVQPHICEALQHWQQEQQQHAATADVELDAAQRAAAAAGSRCLPTR